MVDRAISIRHPWARAIASGAKRVENRGRPTSYRGPVGIHASRKIDRAGDHDGRILRWFGEEASLAMPLGAVLAVADLVDCHLATQTCLDDRCGPWGELHHNDGPAYHLVFVNIRRLRRPVYVAGALAVPWRLPELIAAAVNRELANA